MVLFDISKGADLILSINSIQRKAPGSKVYIVATHCDQVDKNTIYQLSDQLKTQIDRWKKRMPNKELINFQTTTNAEGKEMVFWPVNNHNEKECESLFNSIYSNHEIETFPVKYIGFLRLIYSKRIVLQKCPVVLETVLKVWAEEYGISTKVPEESGNMSEYEEVVELLRDWGDIIILSEINNLIIIDPCWFADFFTTLFNSSVDNSEFHNKPIYLHQIQTIWSTNNYDPYLFPFFWSFLFHYKICVPIRSKGPASQGSTIPAVANNSVVFNNIDRILMPCFDKKRESESNNKRDKFNRNQTCILGRQFEFDFILPEFIDRLINMVLTICLNSKLFTIEYQEIYQNQIDFQLRPTKPNENTSATNLTNYLTNPSYNLIEITVREISSPNASSFSSTVELRVVSSQEIKSFTQKLLSLACFHIDNFVRDFYPQLHENHMKTWCVSNFNNLYKSNPLQKVALREQCVQDYFIRGLHEIHSIPVEDLIPEIINPIHSFSHSENPYDLHFFCFLFFSFFKFYFISTIF